MNKIDLNFSEDVLNDSKALIVDVFFHLVFFANPMEPQEPKLEFRVLAPIYSHHSSAWFVAAETCSSTKGHELYQDCAI